MRDPTERDVQEIVQVGLWFDSLHWVMEKEGLYVCCADTQFDSSTILELKGLVNLKTGEDKWSLFFNRRRVIALENHHRHHNPDCNWQSGPHVHQWSDRCGNEKHAEAVSFPGDDDPIIAYYWFPQVRQSVVHAEAHQSPCNACFGRFGKVCRVTTRFRGCRSRSAESQGAGRS